MAYIRCGRCGVRLKVVRVSRDTLRTTWDSEASIGCQEIKERLAKGEESVPAGECSAADEALKRAINLGQV